MHQCKDAPIRYRKLQALKPIALLRMRVCGGLILPQTPNRPAAEEGKAQCVQVHRGQ